LPLQNLLCSSLFPLCSSSFSNLLHASLLSTPSVHFTLPSPSCPPSSRFPLPSPLSLSHIPFLVSSNLSLFSSPLHSSLKH
jgi:hypothetical protein